MMMTTTTTMMMMMMTTGWYHKETCPPLSSWHSDDSQWCNSTHSVRWSFEIVHKCSSLVGWMFSWVVTLLSWVGLVVLRLSGDSAPKDWIFIFYSWFFPNLCFIPIYSWFLGNVCRFEEVNFATWGQTLYSEIEFLNFMPLLLTNIQRRVHSGGVCSVVVVEAHNPLRQSSFPPLTNEKMVSLAGISQWHITT